MDEFVENIYVHKCKFHLQILFPLSELLFYRTDVSSCNVQNNLSSPHAVNAMAVTGRQCPGFSAKRKNGRFSVISAGTRSIVKDKDKDKDNDNDKNADGMTETLLVCYIFGILLTQSFKVRWWIPSVTNVKNATNMAMLAMMICRTIISQTLNNCNLG